jgi:hypothetical protein
MADHETTPQTIEALENIVKAFAGERSVTVQFVYGILRGDKLDEYYRFKHNLFRPTLNVSTESARVFVTDLQSEIDRRERVRFEPVDHGLVVDAMTQYLSAVALGKSKPKCVELLRHEHAMVGRYLKSIELETEAPATDSQDGGSPSKAVERRSANA